MASILHTTRPRGSKQGATHDPGEHIHIQIPQKACLCKITHSWTPSANATPGHFARVLRAVPGERGVWAATPPALPGLPPPPPPPPPHPPPLHQPLLASGQRPPPLLAPPLPPKCPTLRALRRGVPGTRLVALASRTQSTCRDCGQGRRDGRLTPPEGWWMGHPVPAWGQLGCWFGRGGGGRRRGGPRE
jgi:hypothetical protein